MKIKPRSSHHWLECQQWAWQRRGFLVLPTCRDYRWSSRNYVRGLVQVLYRGALEALGATGKWKLCLNLVALSFWLLFGGKRRYAYHLHISKRQSWAQESWQTPGAEPAKSHHGRSARDLRHGVSRGPSCLPLQVQNREHVPRVYAELRWPAAFLHSLITQLRSGVAKAMLLLCCQGAAFLHHPVGRKIPGWSPGDCELPHSHWSLCLPLALTPLRPACLGSHLAVVETTGCRTKSLCLEPPGGILRRPLPAAG